VRSGFGEFCEGGFHNNTSMRPTPGCVIGNCGWIIDIVRSSLVSFSARCICSGSWSSRRAGG
jgi:hypothetical protein